MPAAQPLLPLPRSAPARLRSVRRAFVPAPAPGAVYRLPRDIQDRLTTALAPFRNRDAAHDLAVFIGRYWSAPNRISRTFVIDRRALSKLNSLELSEARVRGALRVLGEVGFIDRVPIRTSPYHATAEGLRRKPVAYQFAAEFAALFVAANRRARAARERLMMARPLPIPGDPLRPSTASSATLPGRIVSSPKWTPSVAGKVNSGDHGSATVINVIAPRGGPENRAPQTPLHPGLEAALARWKRAAEGAGVIKVAAPVRFAEEPQP